MKYGTSLREYYQIGIGNPDRLIDMEDSYDPENDIGPNAPVTWREHALLIEIKDLSRRIKKLEEESE